MPLRNARKKAPSVPPPIAPSDVLKSRSGKSGLKMQIITRPNPVFTPTTTPENKPMVAPKIPNSLVVGVLPVTSRVPPTARAQSRRAAPKKKLSMPSLPCLLNAHANRELETHRNAMITIRFMRMLSPLPNGRVNPAINNRCNQFSHDSPRGFNRLLSAVHGRIDSGRNSSRFCTLSIAHYNNSMSQIWVNDHSRSGFILRSVV